MLLGYWLYLVNRMHLGLFAWNVIPQVAMRDRRNLLKQGNKKASSIAPFERIVEP